LSSLSSFRVLSCCSRILFRDSLRCSYSFSRLANSSDWLVFRLFMNLEFSSRSWVISRRSFSVWFLNVVWVWLWLDYSYSNVSYRLVIFSLCVLMIFSYESAKLFISSLCLADWLSIILFNCCSFRIALSLSRRAFSILSRFYLAILSILYYFFT
jgi:hypothetical protein